MEISKAKLISSIQDALRNSNRNEDKVEIEKGLLICIYNALIQSMQELYL